MNLRFPFSHPDSIESGYGKIASISVSKRILKTSQGLNTVNNRLIKALNCFSWIYKTDLALSLETLGETLIRDLQPKEMKIVLLS